MKILKIPLITLYILFLSNCLYAQEKKYLVGGSLGFMHSRQSPSSVFFSQGNSQTETRVSAAPTFGYMVNENVMLGSSVEYMWSRNENRFTPASTRQTLLLSPQVRRYVESLLFLHFQGNFGLEITRQDASQFNDMPASDFRRPIIGLALGMGVAIRLAENVELQPIISHSFNYYIGRRIGGFNQNNMIHSYTMVNVGFVFRF